MKKEKLPRAIRDIRRPVVAGSFYPADPVRLEGMVDQFIEHAPSFGPQQVRAIIVPHAGYIYSGVVAAVGYKLLKSQHNPPSRIVAIGPAHTLPIEGMASDTHAHWESPLGNVAVENIGKPIREAHMQEHALEVQLPFLQRVLAGFTLMPLLVGDMRPADLAANIEPHLDNKTLLLISSDLSHYLPYEQACIVDTATIRAIVDMDSGKLEAQGDACGLIPIAAAVRIARKKGWRPLLLEYKNSGDTGGDRAHVVGYTCIAFFEA